MSLSVFISVILPFIVPACAAIGVATAPTVEYDALREDISGLRSEAWYKYNEHARVALHGINPGSAPSAHTLNSKQKANGWQRVWRKCSSLQTDFRKGDVAPETARATIEDLRIEADSIE